MVSEVVTFADQIKSEFLRLYGEYGIADASEKRKPDMIDAIWCDIYELVFKPSDEDVRYNNTKSKLVTWKVEDVESVTKMFVKLNKLYGGVVKYNQFSNLTGINRYTLYLWNKKNNTNGYIFSLSESDIRDEYNNIYIINNGNGDIEYKGNNRFTLQTNDKLSSLRFDVIKKLQEEMQDSNTNALSLDTTGNIVRANHEKELGKNYERESMRNQEEARLTVRTKEEIMASYGMAAIEEKRGLPEVPE